MIQHLVMDILKLPLELTVHIVEQMDNPTLFNFMLTNKAGSSYSRFEGDPQLI
jgi:hypothetical protein